MSHVQPLPAWELPSTLPCQPSPCSAAQTVGAGLGYQRQERPAAAVGTSKGQPFTGKEGWWASSLHCEYNPTDWRHSVHAHCSALQQHNQRAISNSRARIALHPAHPAELKPSPHDTDGIASLELPAEPLTHLSSATSQACQSQTSASPLRVEWRGLRPPHLPQRRRGRQVYKLPHLKAHRPLRQRQQQGKRAR